LKDPVAGPEGVEKGGFGKSRNPENLKRGTEGDASLVAVPGNWQQNAVYDKIHGEKVSTATLGIRSAQSSSFSNFKFFKNSLSEGCRWVLIPACSRHLAGCRMVRHGLAGWCLKAIRFRD
jgi:hypothetical protein